MQKLFKTKHPKMVFKTIEKSNAVYALQFWQIFLKYKYVNFCFLLKSFSQKPKKYIFDTFDKTNSILTTKYIIS